MAGLTTRIAEAIEAALAKNGTVAPVDIATRLGWLRRDNEQRWRQGRTGSLEEAMAFPADKLTHTIALVRAACEARGLTPLDATPVYVAATREQAALRFTRSLGDDVERAWRTHWVAPGAVEKKRKALEKKAAAAPELLVHVALRPEMCRECGDLLAQGEHVLIERDAIVCVACAGLDHLVFLPSGDTGLTRRAKAESALSAVVVRFNKARKRWDRQGLLVDEGALERAEARCLADADARERKRARGAERRAREDQALVQAMTDAIARLFPSCPGAEAADIARHAAERSSGRVGRSAAGRALQDRAVTLAVVAHVRHVHTDYDAMLARGVERHAARDQIQDDIERVLARWRDSGHAPR